MFRLKDRVFDIESAVLFAEIRKIDDARKMWGDHNEGIGWFIEVRTAEREPCGDETDDWQPCAECVCQFPPLITWREIEGQKLEWGDSWDERMGNQRGSLYVFNHCPINNSRLTFSNRREARFDFHWEGKSNLGWDENFDFLIETTVQFIGIAVYEKDAATARDMLARFQNPAEFREGPLGTYAGSLVTQFQPVAGES